MNAIDVLINALTVFLSVGAALFLSFRYIAPQIKTQFVNMIQTLVTGQTSQHMSDLGKLSGETRLEKSMERAAGDDILQQANPLLATVLNSMPSLKKWIMQDPGTRIPMAIAMADKFTPQITGFLQGPSPSTSGGVSNVLQRLKAGQ